MVYPTYCLISCFDIIHFPFCCPLHINFIFHVLEIIRESNVVIRLLTGVPIFYLFLLFTCTCNCILFLNCNNLLVYHLSMVKKIREVATLSRLQHQHVVRYYQVQMSIIFFTNFRIIVIHSVLY